MSKTKTTTSVASSKIAAPAVKSTTVTTTVSSARSKNASKRARKRRGVRNPGGTQAFMAYVNCLNDPFDYPPVPLGFGTMVPTRLGTAYYRGEVTVNSADGSAQVWVSPSSLLATATAAGGGFFMASSDGYSTTPTFSVFANPSNQAALLQDFDQLRIVACGVRCFSNVGASFTPGWFYAQIYPPPRSGNLPNNTTNGSSTATWVGKLNISTHLARDPLQVVWRPDDSVKLALSPQNVTTTSDLNTAPLININLGGFVNSAKVLFEVVCHVEGYASNATSDLVRSNIPTVKERYGFETAAGLLDAAAQCLTPFSSPIPNDTSIGMSSRNFHVYANFRTLPSFEERKERGWFGA